MKKVFYLLIILCLVLTSCTSTKETQISKDEKTASEILQKDEDKIDYHKFGPGTYEVGKDIPAGEYEVLWSSYVSILTDKSILDGGEIIDLADGFSIIRYVEVNDGEFLKIEDDDEINQSENGEECFVYPADEFPPYESDIYILGTYKVGKDIPAGNYKVTLVDGETSGYVAREEYPIGKNARTIVSANIKGPTDLLLEEGEYVKLSGGAQLNMNDQ